MTNSSLTSPGLIKAANDALVAATPDLNIARLFAYDMSYDFADYGTTVKVPVATAGTISSFNMSTNDYENEDGTVTYQPVVLSSQPKSTFAFKGLDLIEAPNAPYWNRCAEAAANGIKGVISKTLGGLFTTTACTGGKAVLSTDLSAITLDDITSLRSECLGRTADTVLALDPTYYNKLLGLLPVNVLGDASAIRDGYIGNIFGFKAAI